MSEKASQKKTRSLEEMVGSLSAQLDVIGKQLTANNDQLAAANKRLDEQAARFEKLEAILAATRDENADLKTKLLNRDCEILELKTRINNVEQHSRSSCIRIFKLQIDGDEKDPIVVAQEVYHKLLGPIFQGAVEMKRFRYLPTADQCIVTAHILPGKDNKIKPILVRLVSGHIRTLIMQLKKDFAPKAPLLKSAASKAPAPGAAGSPRPPPQLYSVFEDMTKDAFQLMRALSSHERVHSCWCSGGQLRFRLVDNENIMKVQSIYDSIEKIINM